MLPKTLHYVTGNKKKFGSATEFLTPLGIIIKQVDLDTPEIQSSSVEEIITDKVNKAFAKINAPLFVNDSIWQISALNGFPGPYMKFINKWFTPEDFLNLMDGKNNRDVVLKQVIAYKDSKNFKIFTHECKGKILYEVRGNSGIPSDRVISMSNNGMSISQTQELGTFALENEKQLWEEFASWLKIE